MSTASGERGARREHPSDVDATDERFGHGVGVDGVVRAGNAFLEGVELHLSGQRIRIRIDHLTRPG
jgi:hypothetical protein